MKYGYLFYRKPLRSEKKERPMNMGDPIQSLAAINLFREMGIPEEDIIPVDRYDTAIYDGDEVILSVNCADNFEYRCYPTAYFPFSPKIKPLMVSFHLDRKVREDELIFFKKYGPVGCRDEYTLNFMRELGVEAYLFGCLTITFSRRKETEHQNKVFLVDCPSALVEYIPKDLHIGAITLSNILKVKSKSNDNRITKEEAESYHKKAYEQLWRLRDEAKLVVTSKLHVATPCLAMGIPVILAKENNFDIRFGFIDKFLPLYIKEHYHEINWSPVPQNIEKEKALVKECFFSSVRAAAARSRVSAMYESIDRTNKLSYGMDIALSMIPLPENGEFQYAIWGVCLHATFILYDDILKNFPKAVLVNMIDTNASGKILDVDIIHPDNINELNEDVIIFVTAPSAHKPAKELLINTKHLFVLVKNVNTESYNFPAE
jgi:hypothetical protein